MQEVFEKIIERLENLGNIRFSDFSQPLITVETAVEIVKQTAAEYNNGWIPVEKRLPEESGKYCVTTEDIEIGDRTEQTIWFAHKDDYDMDESEWRGLCDYEKVVAWKKSAPYQPKGE